MDGNNSTVRVYIWGSDASGTAQGAGGVGGLLMMRWYPTPGAVSTNYFFAYDGNHNVAALVNGNDGTTVAQYEYGPFGELIRASGFLSKSHLFRFSTKYQDDETDLNYYGYRYYAAST